LLDVDLGAAGLEAQGAVGGATGPDPWTPALQAISHPVVADPWSASSSTLASPRDPWGPSASSVGGALVTG